MKRLSIAVIVAAAFLATWLWLSLQHSDDKQTSSSKPEYTYTLRPTQLNLYIDPDTKCHYLVLRIQGGITPRFTKEGYPHQMGCDNKTFETIWPPGEIKEMTK